VQKSVKFEDSLRLYKVIVYRDASLC